MNNQSFGSILLIDDDQTSNFIASQMLNKYNKDFIINYALNGLEGISYLEKNIPLLPNLILLDLNMPIMDGFDFLRCISDKSEFSELKICVYSTSNRSEDKSLALSFKNVVAYIEKPLTLDKILEIEKLLFQSKLKNEI